MRFVALILFVAVHASGAPIGQRTKPEAAQKDLTIAVEEQKRLAQLKASLAGAKKTAQDTYKAAAKLRHDAKIIDPDPEGEFVAVAEAPENAPKAVAYNALKQEYLKAKGKANEAQRALNAALKKRSPPLEPK